MNCWRYERAPKISNDESMALNVYSTRKSTKLSSVSCISFALPSLVIFSLAVAVAVCAAIVGRDKNYLFSILPDKPISNRFVDDVSLPVYQTKQRTIELSLFTASTRPQHIQQMYEKAAAAAQTTAATLPVSNGPHMGKTNNVDDCFLMRCSPMLGSTRHKITKKIDTEIETRIVSAHSVHSFFLLFVSTRDSRLDSPRLDSLGSFKCIHMNDRNGCRFVCHCNSCEELKKYYSISCDCIQATKVDVPFPSLILCLSLLLPFFSLLPLKISANGHRAKRSAK